MITDRQKDQKISDYVYRVNVRENGSIISKYLCYDGFRYDLTDHAGASVFSRDTESLATDLAKYSKITRKLAAKAFVSIKPVALNLNDDSEGNYTRAIRLQLRWFRDEPIPANADTLLWEKVLDSSVRRVSMADIYEIMPEEYDKPCLKKLYQLGYKVFAEPIQIPEAAARINRVSISKQFDSNIPWGMRPEFDHKMERYYRDQGKMWPPQIVISFSGGKDSTAQLIRLLEENVPIHSVYTFDTGWEFDSMYRHWTAVEKYTGIKINRLRSPHNFDDLLKKYRWPSKGRRWCTSEKISAARRYVKNLDPRYVYLDTIGFAADEEARTMTKAVYSRPTLFPMIDNWKMEEKDALEYCYQHGFNWDGLYQHFDRLSCFCCPLSSKSEMWALRQHFPHLWKRMEDMENAIPKGKYIPYIKNNMGVKDYGQWLDHQYSMLGLMGGSCQAGGCSANSSLGAVA